MSADTRIYLDHAATTPLHPQVLEVMLPYWTQHYGNPSSIHAHGRAARAAVEQARKTVAQLLEVSVGEVFFTSGATEAANAVLKTVVQQRGVQRVVSARTEHHCVLHTLDWLEHRCGLMVEYLPLLPNGCPDVAALEQTLQSDRRPTLVALMHGNNETGTLLPLEWVAQCCREYGAWLMSDTVQTVGHLVLRPEQLPLHYALGSAHKFHGPKGVGFMYVRQGENAGPWIHGGAQERNARAGTEHVAGIVGLAKALELALQHRTEHQRYLWQLKRYFMQRLLAVFGELVRINGSTDEQRSLAHILSVAFPPSPRAELLVFNLDIAGVSASGGSACSSGVEAASHVLAAMYPDDVWRTVRFSMSHLNTMAEIDVVVGHLQRLLLPQHR